MGVGIGLVFALRDLYAAQAWTAKQGVITHSYVRQVRGYMNRPFWHAEIAGRYVDGSGTFGVSRHAYGIQNAVNTRAQAEAVTKRYPKGAMLDVYPKPDQPRTAILHPNASPTPSWIALAASVGFILLPFALSPPPYARRGFVRPPVRTADQSARIPTLRMTAPHLS